MFTVMIVVCLLKSMCIPRFVLIGCCMSELHGHLCPIIMYCLRLFVVVLQDLNCLPYVYTKVRLDWLLHERVTWPSMPYHNVLPEAVCCCFTRPLHVFMIRLIHCRLLSCH